MYCMSVRSLSPPKPAGVDPLNFHRHAPNWMWNRDSPNFFKFFFEFKFFGKRG
jgi:hypothetical protein